MRGAVRQLIIYGGGNHGFTPENATGPQSGVTYHARSDARSPIAIKDFLAEIFTE